jgi:hypothetical protein
MINRIRQAPTAIPIVTQPANPTTLLQAIQVVLLQVLAQVLTLSSIIQHQLLRIKCKSKTQLKKTQNNSFYRVILGAKLLTL